MTLLHRAARERRFDASTDDQGFTLIELLVTMAVASVMMALAVTGWKEYGVVQAHRGAADGAVALLREAQQKAVTEGSYYAVSFDSVSGPWTVRQGSCTGTLKDSFQPASGRISASAVAFPTSPTLLAGSATTCVVFKPRGTASDGSLKIVRAGSATKFFKIDVEGLTGRVTIT